MNRRILKHPRTISTIVEDDVYQAFADTLPRHKTVAEAIREYMASAVEESKKARAQE